MVVNRQWIGKRNRKSERLNSCARLPNSNVKCRSRHWRFFAFLRAWSMRESKKEKGQKWGWEGDRRRIQAIFQENLDKLVAPCGQGFIKSKSTYHYKISPVQFHKFGWPVSDVFDHPVETRFFFFLVEEKYEWKLKITLIKMPQLAPRLGHAFLYWGQVCVWNNLKWSRIRTLYATLILVSFLDECFRNSLEKKSFNFKRHRISHFEDTNMFPIWEHCWNAVRKQPYLTSHRPCLSQITSQHLVHQWMSGVFYLHLFELF